MKLNQKNYFRAYINILTPLTVSLLGLFSSLAIADSFNLLRDQIGKREQINSPTGYDEFLSTETSPIYVIGSKELKKVRQWIGTSLSDVESQRKPRTQILRIPKNSDWNKKIVQIYIFPHFLSGDLNYLAKISQGKGKILSGSMHTFKTNEGNVRSEFWEIRVAVEDTLQELDIEIQGKQNKGNNYIYFDSLEARQFSKSNVSAEGFPIYRSFPGINFEGNEVLSSVYVQNGSTLQSRDEKGNVRWTIQTPVNSQISGGMDADQDGIVDATLTYWENTGASCNTNYIGNSKISLLKGKSGAITDLTSTTQDICWPRVKPDGGMNYATIQWANYSLLFGQGSQAMLSTLYETQPWLYDLSAVPRAIGYLFYPSSSWFDTFYQYHRPNAYGDGNYYTNNAHAANGMIVNVRGENRAVFFTSSRVVQYGVESYWSGQLRADYPFLSGGRTDLAGRNYGLIQTDTMNPHLLHLVSGDINYSVYSDMLSGSSYFNLWGGLERHVTVYDMVNNGLNDKFFSYGKDKGVGNPWLGRVTAAGHSIFRVNDFTSRYAYNVFNASGSAPGWTIHISNAGNSAASITVPNLFLWDMVDIDGDGLEELICSPTVSNNYSTSNETLIYKWSEVTKSLILVKRISGFIPKLIPRFYEPNRKSTYSALFDVGVFEKEGVLQMILINPSTKKTRIWPMQ